MDVPHDSYEGGGTRRRRYGADDVVQVPCPYCGSTERHVLYREHGSLAVVRCVCSQIYTSPRLRAPEEVYHGDRDTYFREARLIFEGRASHHRDPNYREELDLVARYRPGGDFLDVGCNMGMLLRKVRERGWRGVGVEPSPALASLAVEELGLDVFQGFLHDVPASENGRYDVVALSDVFEHVTDPLALLAEVRRLLAPDGILYVKVPNARFNILKQKVSAFLGRELQHPVWDSYEHVVHYTDATLRRMLEKGGFHVLELTTPRPVQLPVWHHRVGHYFQYPSPFVLDWKRYLGRALCHGLGRVERLARLGSVGYFSSSLAAVAERAP